MTRTQRAVVAVLVLVFALVGLWTVGQLFRGRDTEVRPPPVATRAVGRAGGTVGVFVEPDDGRGPILAELDAARESITLEVYLLGDEEIIAALERAVDRGVEVRVILEEEPFGGAGTQPEVFERLRRAGIGVRWDNPAFRFSHIKTFVVDRETAIVMNLNLTKTSFTKNREFGAITTRPAEVAQAAAIFEADWARAAEPPPGPLIVSPTTSRRDLLNLMDGAAESMDIYAEVVRDEEIVDALVAAEDRGAEIRLLVSPRSGDERAAEIWLLLADSGVEVRFQRGLYVHAKMVLVDGARAYVGSQNFTATSLDDNRELGIMIDDPANLARLSQTFAEDFADARPVDAG